MPVTLISPKALLNYCGIRTYFNDELCFIMPDGTLVEFFESSTSFMVPFADDTDPITIARRANKSKWPWTQDTCDSLRLTLQQPLPITWDLLHDRLCHYGPDKIYDSREFICGIDTTLLSSPSRNRKSVSIVFTALSVATATSQGHLAFIYGLVNGFIRILV